MTRTITEFEAKQCLKWFIQGYFIHCIPQKLFSNMDTLDICRLYNVKPLYFGL